jgi:hypothetical protein
MTSRAAAKASTRNDALAALLLEAGSLRRRWQSAEIRKICSRNIDGLFLPGIDELGPQKFHMAIAIRAAARALQYAGDDATRERLACAIGALVDVAQAASRPLGASHGPRLGCARSGAGETGRAWWVE